MSLVPANVERLVPYVPGKPVEELERELGIDGAIKLASNENPYGPSPRALEAIRAHLDQLHRYPDAAAFALRGAIAEHHGVAREEVVVGNGSNELIDLVCRTYAGPGDHAVIGAPSFVCYPLGLTAANVPYDTVPLRDHLTFDLEAMCARVTSKTRLFFVVNPNNPTGTHVGRAALVSALRALPEHVLVVLDEAYVEFADALDYESGLALRDLRERLIILRTFSKAYGLAATRCGYAIGPADVVGYLHRTRAPFNVNTLAQIAAMAALGDQDYVARYVAANAVERARVTLGLEALGLSVAPSQANFVLADFRTVGGGPPGPPELGEPNAEVYDRLLRMGVIIRPMPPPLGTWLRITIGLPSENDRLLASVAALRNER